MKHSSEFPFDRARRITVKETAAYRKEIANRLGCARPRRVGRPPKRGAEKYRAVSMRLHPQILKWARMRGRRLGLGYQTVINRTLLRLAA